MDNLAANLDASVTFLCRVMCKHTSPDDATYSEVTAHDGDASHRILCPCTKLEVRIGLPVRKTGHISVSALIGLDILTFDLSTSKWGHGSHVSWASFLPIVSLLRPSVLDLGSSMRQTDRQTAINA